jgi:hypothetical protein
MPDSNLTVLAPEPSFYLLRRFAARRTFFLVGRVLVGRDLRCVPFRVFFVRFGRLRGGGGIGRPGGPLGAGVPSEGGVGPLLYSATTRFGVGLGLIVVRG